MHGQVQTWLDRSSSDLTLFDVIMLTPVISSFGRTTRALEISDCYVRLAFPLPPILTRLGLGGIHHTI